MINTNKCLVLTMKEDGRLPMGKHEAHPPHDWWYTSWGGGHQLHDGWTPTEDFGDGCGRDIIEGYVKKHRCPGRN